VIKEVARKTCCNIGLIASSIREIGINNHASFPLGHLSHGRAKNSDAEFFSQKFRDFLMWRNDFFSHAKFPDALLLIRILSLDGGKMAITGNSTLYTLSLWKFRGEMHVC
jgi:hypothetical protein